MTLDLVPIYNVESNVEPGLCRILALKTGVQECHPMHGDSELKGDRIELKLTLGPETGQCFPLHEATALPNAWEYSLLCRVVTTRRKGSRKEHSLIRAKIRVALLYVSEALTATELPYHQLVQVSHSGTDPHIESDNEQDVSDLSFTGVVAVRDSAWG
jgi:hypothetical protein